MHEINWNRFELKNPNPQDAFETMCRNIFLREYKVSSHNFSANYNQAGLETEPVLFNGKYWHGSCGWTQALIPMPNYVTNHIDRASYKLACPVNSDIENLKRYIVSSGLIVD